MGFLSADATADVSYHHANAIAPHMSVSPSWDATRAKLPGSTVRGGSLPRRPPMKNAVTTSVKAPVGTKTSSAPAGLHFVTSKLPGNAFDANHVTMRNRANATRGVTACARTRARH